MSCWAAETNVLHTPFRHFFPAFGNQKSQTEALTLKDRTCLQKGRIQDNQWFLLFPRCLLIFFWIFSPGEFKDYLHLIKNFVYSVRSVRERHSWQVQSRLSGCTEQVLQFRHLLVVQEKLFRCDTVQSDVFLSEKFREQKFWIRAEMCDLPVWR